MGVKISILVPIYNVEKYLRQCLDSILAQSFSEFEVICINDGSTDSSLAIINEYARRDGRIKLIDKPNTGYGDSMNLGLLCAKGKYIGIVEPDDFINNLMYENLYSIAERNNADVVKSDYYLYSSDNMCRKAGKISKLHSGKLLNSQKYPKLLTLQPTIWSAIYKKEFLEKFDIKFLPTKGASYQDTSFSFKVMALAERVVLTDKAYLYYRVDNMMSSVHSKDKVFAICDEYEEITDFLTRNSNVKMFANTNKLIKQYSAYMWNLFRIDEKYRIEFVDRFSATFREYLVNGEINQKFYSSVNKRLFILLVKDKKKFLEWIQRYSVKENQKELRRKNFSLRLNFSRISLVMFGKRVMEIEF